MGAAELFFFYLLAAAAPLSLASINVAQVGLSLFFLARLILRKIRFGPAQWALVAFFAWNTLSAALSPLPSEALVGVLDYWCWTPFLLAGALPAVIRARSSRFAAFLALAACATIPMDLAQFFLGTDFNHGQRLFRNAPVGTVNAYGFFSHHLTYAGMLSLALFLSAGYALYAGRRRRLWAGATAILGAGLILTMARSYLLAAIPAGLALLWRRGRLWVAGAAATALLVGVVLLLAGPQKLRDRATSLLDPHHPSNAERIYLWAAALEMIRDRPVAGWGPGIYPETAEPYKAPYATKIHYPDRKEPGFRTVSHCHSLYLMVLIYSGAVGFALFLLFLALALRDLLRQTDFALRYGALAGLVTFLFGGLFEFNGGDAEVATLAFFLLGLGGAESPPEPEETPEWEESADEEG